MKLMVIDGNSIVNRSFYGVRPLTTKDGLYTNAIYGFVTTLQRLMDEDLDCLPQENCKCPSGHIGIMEPACCGNTPPFRLVFRGPQLWEAHRFRRSPRLCLDGVFPHNPGYT